MPHFRHRSPALVGLAVICLLPGLSLFKVPDPELIYDGSAPGLGRGVLVLRDAATFREAVVPLDPDYGGPEPDFGKIHSPGFLKHQFQVNHGYQ